MKKDEEKILVQIAQMYYLENKTQSEISKELHIHRSTISRLLKQCRKEGIVTITINYDHKDTLLLEQKIKAKYHLQEVAVVPTASGLPKEQKLKMLGEATDEYFQKIVEDNMVIGFSWGITLATVVRQLKDPHKQNLTCIPLIGGSSGQVKGNYHVNTVTFMASQNINGGAILIDAPAFASTPEMRDLLLKNDLNKQLIEYWNHVDIAIVGIGSPQANTNRWRYFYGEDIFKELAKADVAGDIFARYFDENGRHIESSLDQRVISIDVPNFMKIKYRIGVAESLEKVKAIRAACLGGYINALITTQETAEKLID